MKEQHYIPTIGLEIHVQLDTKSKIFCGDATEFEAEPNTQTSVISLAHPGTLPKLNKAAVEMAIKIGLVLDSQIAPQVVFDRKHYFYPDSPKGYQITQHSMPICKGGSMELEMPDGNKKVVRFHQVHLEDDAGKSVHDLDPDNTLVDLNRAGMPLIEMVTEPDMSTAEEVGVLLEEIRKTVRAIGISDGNMEQGSLRCDANISIRPVGTEELGKKVEIKNMNSIRYVKKAIEYEIQRQSEILDAGKTIEQESRLFDTERGITLSMREKEDANDYRYYPDPDLVPYVVSKEWLQELKESLPKLPKEIKEDFIKEYGIPEYDAGVLSDSVFLSKQFQLLMKEGIDAKRTSNWLMGPIQSWYKEQSNEHIKLPVKSLAKVIQWVEEGKITNMQGTQVLLPALLDNYQLDIEQFATSNQLFLSDDTNVVDDAIISVLKNHPEEVERYRKGKKGLIQLFVGKVMAETKGKADPKQVVSRLQEELNK